MTQKRVQGRQQTCQSLGYLSWVLYQVLLYEGYRQHLVSPVLMADFPSQYSSVSGLADFPFILAETGKIPGGLYASLLKFVTRGTTWEFGFRQTWSPDPGLRPIRFDLREIT